MYKYLDIPVVLKISPLLFARLKNLRIYESVKMNVRLYVSSFPIPETCTSTWIQSAVALQLVMFSCFDKSKEVIFGLIQNNFSHLLKNCVWGREREREKERERWMSTFVVAFCFKAERRRHSNIITRNMNILDDCNRSVLWHSMKTLLNYMRSFDSH